ncbi:sugar MFS transporter [Neptunicella marina]|uniref:Sugar MFS transporter n=1 Tax=Neptunicella marina TaxID=2125989 RepID=A0A8J6IU79_9ALTE|nr:sugar MFS transporter [Neptunicella marina]MBC3765716.1 sugar MFS transporter [Neptunicella marina]
MQATALNAKSQSNLVPIALIGLLFFIFGFITWLNGALIPFLQIVCDLSQTQALFIASSFYIAYTVMAMPMAWILERAGYKNAISIGLLMVAAGFLLFIPAAETHAFALFLLAQFVVGTSLTLLQTAANPYIVKIGPQETAAVRIFVMGLLNKGAGVLAPLFFAALVVGEFKDVTIESVNALPDAERIEQIKALADGLVLPYLCGAIVWILAALFIKKSSLPELELEDENAELAAEGGSDNSKNSVFQFPHLVLGAITIFVYVGVEVIAGDTIGLFGSKLGVANATTLTSYTMGFMLVGYALGLVLIPRVLSQQSALLWSSALGVIISLLIVISDPASTLVSEVLWGWSGMQTLPDIVTFVAMFGFANAVVWPAVWPLALDGLGKLTPKGSALLIMGIAGGAILPILYGVLADTFGGQHAYLMMIPCYLFILFYAAKGHKIKNW